MGYVRQDPNRTASTAARLGLIIFALLLVGMLVLAERVFPPDTSPNEHFVVVKTCPGGYVLKRGDRGSWIVQNNWTAYTATAGACS